jgi:hypothetical protein
MAPKWCYWMIFILMMVAAVQHLSTLTPSGTHWGAQWIAIAWLLYRVKLNPWPIERKDS